MEERKGKETMISVSEDGMTATILHVQDDGTRRIVTLSRDPAAGPFTEKDLAYAEQGMLNALKHGQPGQRNRTRRDKTRFGTLWTHVMLGPPTWWWPRVSFKHEVMAGWLRLAVAVKFEKE
jgi:hypothetical protein